MRDYYLETAVCKILGSESLWRVADLGLQIAAGCGYMKEYPYERLMRDARINLIFEGTNEILRCFLALSGVRGPSEKLRAYSKITNMGKALENPIKSLGLLTHFARDRISRMLPSRQLSGVHPRLERWGQRFLPLLSEFSHQVEKTLFRFGPGIVDHELPQKRLADMAIHLYVMVAVIGRTSSVLDDPGVQEGEKTYCLLLAENTLSASRKTVIANLAGMARNRDRETGELSRRICAHDGRAPDIIEF